MGGWRGVREYRENFKYLPPWRSPEPGKTANSTVPLKDANTAETLWEYGENVMSTISLLSRRLIIVVIHEADEFDHDVVDLEVLGRVDRGDTGGAELFFVV